MGRCLAPSFDHPVRRKTGLLVAAALLGTACRSTSEPESKTLAVGWRPAGSWSGNGNAQTGSFDIGSGGFRIRWETSHETPAGAGLFRITVRSGVSGRPLMVAVEHRGAGHDTAYVTDDPRPYYLEIQSRNVDWSIRVDEAVVGPVSAPSGAKSH